MRSRRNIVLLAVALGLIAAVPAAGGAARQLAPSPGADGTAAAPLIPSIVQTRITRAQAALRRANTFADSGQTAKQIASLNTASAQARFAWNAAVYVVKTSPPSAAGDALPDGDAAAGAAYAGREDTAFAAISVQHDVVATTVALMTQAGAKNAALRKSWVKAISTAQAVRNKAVAFVHTRKLPGTFPAVMPGLVPLANDEIKELNGRMKLTGFNGSLRTSLLASRIRAVKTRRLVNKYWPPVPAD
ncbi:MAG TPA: hypothetical protein VFT76_03395 [Actinomycetota bacterium]|nr:hypothetical protein [Actinomycetota bacterium]